MRRSSAVGMWELVQKLAIRALHQPLLRQRRAQMVAMLFMAFIYVVAVIRPEWAPSEPAVPFSVMLRDLADMLPTFALIFLCLGTIYLGVATPTE